MEENLEHLDDLGSPNTYNHYPTGWAMAFSTPFRMFKRYSYQGGVCDPMVDPLAEGHQGEGRGAPPVPPRDRHRPDDPRVLRARVPRDAERPRAGAAARRVDALLVRRAGRADHEGAAVLRDARHARDLGERLEGRRRARADLGHRPLRRRPVAALPHRRRPLRGARPRRGAAREAEGADRRLVRGGGEVRRAAARRPAPARDPRRSAAAARARPHALRLLPGHGRRAGVGRGEHARRARSGSWPRSR